MLICVDIGNTKISVGVMEEDKKLYGFSFPTIKDAPKEYFYKELKAGLKDKCECLICSVCPEVNDNITNAFAKLGINAKVIDPLRLEHMLKIGLKNKKDLGSDIFVGCLASVDSDNDSSIVVDMGTATTLALTYKGVMLGGAICPGVKTSYKNLFSTASLLSEVSFDIPSTAIGYDTPSSVCSGMMYGTIGSVDRIISEMRKSYKVKKIVFTGGMGRFFAPHFKGAVYEEDLIFIGLVKINNYIKGR